MQVQQSLDESFRLNTEEKLEIYMQGFFYFINI